MRATTRSIIVAAVSGALAAGGGVSVATSAPAVPVSLTLACATAEAEAGAAHTSGQTLPAPTWTSPTWPAPTWTDPTWPAPTPTPTCSPTSTPPTSAPPTSAAPPSTSTQTPTAPPTPTPPPTETAPPPRPVPAPPDCSKPPTKAEIEAVFRGWNDALANDADKVTERYLTDAVLLSTLKDKPFKGRDAIRGYFVDFVARKPQGTVTDRDIVILDDHSAVDTGLYTFTFGDGKEPATIKARFTFVYRVVEGKCLIVSHHSSKLPEAR